MTVDRVAANESREVKRHFATSSGSLKSCAHNTPGPVARDCQSAALAGLQEVCTVVPPETCKVLGGHGFDCARARAGKRMPAMPACCRNSLRFITNLVAAVGRQGPRRANREQFKEHYP
jgi:hypothetical protein